MHIAGRLMHYRLHYAAVSLYHKDYEVGGPIIFLSRSYYFSEPVDSGAQKDLRYPQVSERLDTPLHKTSSVKIFSQTTEQDCAEISHTRRFHGREWTSNFLYVQSIHNWPEQEAHCRGGT